MKKRKPKGEGFEPVYKEIGARIHWLRAEKGWSSARLGDAIGVHGSSVHAWEQARARPHVAELRRIAHALGVNLVVFLADLPVEQCQLAPGKREARVAAAAKRIPSLKGKKRPPKKQKG